AVDAVAEPHGVLAQALPRCIEQDLVEVGAMDRELRPVVAGVAAAQVADDRRAVAAVVGERARLDRVRGELVGEAELAELAHAVRQEVDADAERMDLGRGLEDATRDAGLVAAQRQRKPADAAADDQDVRRGGRGGGGAHSGWIPRLLTTSAQRWRSLTTISSSAAGVEAVGTRPCASNTFFASGAFRIAATSRLSWSTIGWGVPLGANRPYHMSTSAPARPASIRVGTSGSCGRR